MNLVWIPGRHRAETAQLPHAIGDKAARLVQLTEAGFTVPPLYCITTAAFRLAVEADRSNPSLSDLLASLADAPASASRAYCGSQVRTAILNRPLLPELECEIAAAHAKLFAEDVCVAVRSSIVGEDGDDGAFAGMHDSVLAVRSQTELFEAVRRVWASAFSDRALAYRAERRLACTDIAPAVIVQQMVDASQSGVAFTCNPATGNVQELVASAVPGLGQALVSGECSGDSYLIDKQARDVTTQLATKRDKLVVAADRHGLARVPLDENEQATGTLSGRDLQTLTDSALAVESLFGRPQDIEFCFDADGRLHLLQSRPVLHVDEYGPAAGNPLVWDNSNIIESYYGVTSPMTFSFIRRAYAIVYHCFSEVMGIPPRVVRAHRTEFENMLGLFRGRVYYNLRNWYRLIRLFPGYRYNSRFMEAMMGLKEPLLSEPAAQQQPGRLRRWFVELPALLGLLARSSWNFLRIRRIVERFQTRFDECYRDWSQIDFRQLPPHEIAALYTRMEDALLWNWKAPIINDFFVMVFFGVLRKLCAKWCGDETGALTNGLVSGERGLASAEPAKHLLRLAAIADDNDELRALILDTSPADLPGLVASDDRFAAFQSEFARYLDLYGFRCVHELKLEEQSYRDRPELVFEQIRRYLELDDPHAIDVRTMEDRQRRLRDDAEQQAFTALAQSQSWWPRRLIFRRVLKNARMGIRNREAMRLARTRIYAILREMLRSIGEQFATERVLDSADDIFWLTLDEVWDFIKGTAVSTDLRGIAALRKAEYDRYGTEHDAAPDHRFVTYGLAYHKNRFRNHQSARHTKCGSVVEGSVALRGLGCCPGVVAGRATVASDPTDALRNPGGILVAARTDPGWVTAYPAFRGILVERGSMLSHSAIVARELGIPTIVGVDGLTSRLRTGDRVKMDGAAGTIEILSVAEAEAGWEQADGGGHGPRGSQPPRDFVDLEVAVEEGQVAGE